MARRGADDNSFSPGAGLWQDEDMEQQHTIRVEEWARPGEPFRLAAVAIGAADWAAVLPATAQARVARFADGHARARAGASEWIKTCWLPRELGLAAVEVRTGANGKPLLEGAAAAWGFNLSHAGEYVVAALARDAQIGVDLESTSRKADIVRLAQRVFSACEQAAVQQGGRAAFFTLWSQKEALVKAVGCGWADERLQRGTALAPVGFQLEPTTGARVWSRPVIDGAYCLAVAMV
ncbi:MAG: 4'-phosphopantetheinyl transferase superfamily protein [Kiritimatiellae bacterium]|nr:4'-phosphopantetheinyl transferase superfamily protein [Kiritimatiellia bacterium]MDD4341358.1 4'-phosphopantetheinyl transferase superfamily protein [Kiritimatiellia bacterium]MDY0149909.1 4'-phosphopantetheinyl transferase superfamily protein [Kiritimatiellia bacterium]